MKIKIVCVEFENLKHFEGGAFKVDFYAADRVFENSKLFNISKSIFAQNLIAFTGLNATGKTSVLRLLKIALNVIVDNTDLNYFETNVMIDDGTSMRVTFFCDDVCYQLESIIGRKPVRLIYKEEILKKKKISDIKTRRDLLNFDNAEVEKRSDLDAEVSKYLDDGKSFIGPIIKGNNGCVSDNLFLNYVNISPTVGKIPAEIIEIFDETIESLTVEDNKSSKWKLKFKGNESVYSVADLLTLNLIISTGTIRGQELIQRAVTALVKGGYLIIDELEMHLNKEIIKVILEFFKSEQTNPYGACLVFSTHYPELLDFMNRKDNIYITRKKNSMLSVSKYSDELKRNDLKKSDIILSNALTGTAPKYENIKKLRDYICALF